MTRAEALRLLELWRDWDGKPSNLLALHGIRSPQDDLLDERRRTLAEAMRVLRSDAGSRQ